MSATTLAINPAVELAAETLRGSAEELMRIGGDNYVSNEDCAGPAADARSLRALLADGDPAAETIDSALALFVARYETIPLIDRDYARLTFALDLWSAAKMVIANG